MTNKKRTFTEYLKFLAKLRDFDLVKIEDILRHSQERYFDTETHRRVAIGKHSDKWVIIPYEETQTEITPITIHPTTRQQIKFRLNTGRFIYE